MSPRSKVFFGYAILWSGLAVLIVLGLGGQLYAVDHARTAEWQALYDTCQDDGETTMCEEVKPWPRN